MEYFNENTPSMETVMVYLTDMGLTILGALVVLILGLWFAGFVERRLTGLFAKTEKIDDTVGNFLASLAKYAVVVVTGIALLDQFGVETTSLIAVLGAAGLAIGLALQGTLSNLAAGVMLLIFRPFKVGQFVEVAGKSGVVKAVSLFTTQLDTGDNVRISIPNNSVWGNSVANFNFHDTRRIQLVFGISYGDDIGAAMEVIKGVLAADERCHTDPEPVIAVTSLGESSVDIMVRVWCASGDFWPLSWQLLRAVKEAFDAKGITIPFPCRTIYTAAD
ncbi:MAG: mechanosensitive ion channel [Alphaproteobacteria bacterium]|nr:MAG: mechanosensitive ion channel [Alphaproteobacteria bacterium]